MDFGFVLRSRQTISILIAAEIMRFAAVVASTCVQGTMSPQSYLSTSIFSCEAALIALNIYLIKPAHFFSSWKMKICN